MATFDTVTEIIVEILGIDGEDITMESKFVEDFGADSLDTIELIMAFEEEFDIEIPDCEDVINKTVGDAVEYINQHVKK